VDKKIFRERKIVPAGVNLGRECHRASTEEAVGQMMSVRWPSVKDRIDWRRSENAPFKPQSVEPQMAAARDIRRIHAPRSFLKGGAAVASAAAALMPSNVRRILAQQPWRGSLRQRPTPGVSNLRQHDYYNRLTSFLKVGLLSQR
jgi:hypothetical protein